MRRPDWRAPRRKPVDGGRGEHAEAVFEQLEPRLLLSTLHPNDAPPFPVAGMPQIVGDAAPAGGSSTDVGVVVRNSGGWVMGTDGGTIITSASKDGGGTGKGGMATSGGEVRVLSAGRQVNLDAKGRWRGRDGSGDLVSVRLKGEGTGTLLFGQDGNCDPVRLTLQGTTEASSLTIKAKGKGTSIQEIVVEGSLKSLKGKKVDVCGDVRVSGLLGTLNLGDVGEAHSIEINTDGLPVGKRSKLNIALGRVVDTSLNTHGLPIGSLTAVEWLDEDHLDNDEIIAPRASSITVKGSLRANVTLTGPTADRGMSLKKLSVAGWLSRSTVRTGGSIGNILLGAASGSRVFAGMDEAVHWYPWTKAHFVNPKARIKSARIKGWKTERGQDLPRLFVGSLFSAATLGAVTLLNIEPENPYGEPWDPKDFGLFTLDQQGGKSLKSLKVRDTVTGEKGWPPSGKSFDWHFFCDFCVRAV